MAEIAKWHSSQILPIIRHNMRRLEDGCANGNKSIQYELTCNNYSLVNRGNTCQEINQYRKQIEKNCYKFKRKNLVHAVEVVIQCPSDCEDAQKTLFFKSCFDYVCSTLPMKEKCVFVAEVHLDEKHYSPNGALLSKGHIHIMYVPAVQDTKYEKYDYKLCADSLTKKTMLKAFHPGLQKYLEKDGIKATVYHPRSGGAKAIGLSVEQLKEITAKTGIKIEKTITIDRFSEILRDGIEKNNEKGRENHSQWGSIDGWGTGYTTREKEVEYEK